MIKIDNEQAILEFGTGDVGFNSGSYEPESEKVGVIVFYNQEARGIGDKADIKANTKVDLNDFPVIMTFKKKESIDVLIKALMDAKDEMEQFELNNQENKADVIREHKYLEEIEGLEETPYSYSENKGRNNYWRLQRKEYGFDERETWSMDTTFFCWLYERLRMYQDIDFVDTDFHKFNINGKELTQGECINKMIQNCKKVLIMNDFEEEYWSLANETIDIWKTCLLAMWW